MKKNWLFNKTVVISGASGGIGFNVAKILIEKYDCKVIGIARNKEKMLNAIESLGDKKANFSYYLFDVSSKNNWLNFYEKLKIDGIIPDVLINNAGFMLPFTKFDKINDEEIDEIVKTNFLSYLYSIKTLMPLLKRSKTPAIINVSSAAGLCAVVGESMYCATKYAVAGLTQTLQQDYKGEIYVAGVYPGFIKTNILNRMSIKDKSNPLIAKMMMPVEKATKKIVRGIKKRKKRIVIGLDGKSMSFFARLFPKFTPSAIRSVLKNSQIELFEEVFNKKEQK